MTINPFIPGGIPNKTYVRTELSTNLKKALRSKKIKYVYGPSKIGKTTALSKIFEEEGYNVEKFVCDATKTADEIEKAIYEFAKVVSNSKRATEASGSAGANFLSVAKLDTTIKGSIENSNSEEVTTKRVKADYLWIDDFHLLIKEERHRLCSRLKRLSEEGINLVIVGVDYVKGEIFQKVSDLSGRVDFLEAGKWTEDDLRNVITQGFEGHLNSGLIGLISDEILKNCFGNPQIVQDIGAILFEELINEKATKTLSADGHLELIEDVRMRIEANSLAGSQSNMKRLERGPDSRGKERIEITFKGISGDSYYVLFKYVSDSTDLIVHLDKSVIGKDLSKESNALIRAANQWIKIITEPVYFNYDATSKELQVLDPYTILAMRGYLRKSEK